MIRMALTSVALPALFLLIGTAAPLHAQHDDPNMEWVMDGPLYDRLGGEEMIMGVIDDFVDAAVEEEQLKGQLEGVDQDAWKADLLAQFTLVAGGEIEYDGKSFKESLGEMGIAEEAMELVADQLTIALEMNEAWPEDVDELLVALELKEAEMTEEEMTEGAGDDGDAGNAGGEANADGGADAGSMGDAGNAGGEANADGSADAGDESNAGNAGGEANADSGADAGDAGDIGETGGEANADGDSRR